MLFDYSLDSYKAPALNSLTRCDELLRTISDVHAGVIRPKTLDPIVEELVHSMSCDSAAKAVTQPQANDFCRLAWWDTSKTTRLEVQAQLLRSFLWKRTYEREVVRQLRAEIIPGNRKALITRLAADLVVEWITLGFSREYIFLNTRTMFFGFGLPPIVDPVSAFDDFVRVFEPNKRKFDVCIRGHKAVSGLGALLPEEIGTITDSAPRPRGNRAKERFFLEGKHDGVYITFGGIEAFDARSARNRAFAILNNVSAIAAFHVHRTPFSVDREALVWQDNVATVLRAPALAIHKHDECSVSELPDRFGKIIEALTPARVGNAAWGRLRAALGLHSSALASDDASVQLTTLWSALEAIVPSPLDEARIQTVLETIVPALTLGYAKKIFSDLHQSLLRCMRVEYSHASTDAGFADTSYLSAAALIAINDNEQLRDRLYTASDINPLLRYRIYSVKRMFDSAAATLTTLRSHRQRISWHLRRIYRTRNMIVHAGRTSQFREDLVEHVHSYLHQVINVLEDVYSEDAYPMTLDAAFLWLRMRNERHLAYLEDLDDAPSVVGNIESVLFGTDLPN
jgi:hypothetical protein